MIYFNFVTEFLEALCSPLPTATTTLPTNDISSSIGRHNPTTPHQTTNNSSMRVGSIPVVSTPIVSQLTESMSNIDNGIIHADEVIYS